MAIDSREQELASAQVALPVPDSPAPGAYEQDAECWWHATLEVLTTLGSALHGYRSRAIAVDATSATLLLSSPEGVALAPARLYHDHRATDAAARIARCAPPDSAARGASSALAKLLDLAECCEHSQPTLALHQADWISARLGAPPGWSDWNNALKLGYDPVNQCWPEWVQALVPDGIQLPRVCAPGTVLGRLAPDVAAVTGLDADTRIVAATTDSTAAVLAAGASEPGDAVTSLGSTLVLKILASQPISAPEFGVYSQRFGEHWLVGGASNSGGAVLRQCFIDTELIRLSRDIDPAQPSGLDYYPLPGPGERFPHADPERAPRMTPRPQDPVRFLHGLLEGMARIEAEGYARLVALGAPAPRRIITLGGGAANPAWSALRARLLGVELVAPRHHEAAFGAARLARAGGASAQCA